MSLLPALSAQQGLDQLFDREYLRLSAALSSYVQSCSAQILDQLGLFHLPTKPTAPQELASRVGVQSDQLGSFAWLVEASTAAGYLDAQSHSGEVTYVPRKRWTSKIHQGVLQKAMDTGNAGASIPILRWITQHYPAVLRGQRSGPMLLLKGNGLQYWEDYFSAKNPVYDAHNRAMGWGIRLALRGSVNRRPPLRLLEIGAGTGGGTSAALDVLDDYPNLEFNYTVTDVAPTFLLRLVERFGDRNTVVSRQKVDMNKPLSEQSVEPASIDLVLATNALHNATDRDRTLRDIAESLRPGGSLILSESICAHKEQVHQEIIFNLLPSPGQQQLVGGRARSRFETAAGWDAILKASPLDSIVLSNNAGPDLGLLAVATRPQTAG